MIGRRMGQTSSFADDSKKVVNVATVPMHSQEARTFLEATRGEPFEALYVLVQTTSLRLGELLGLRWDDVDLERGTLRMSRALSQRGRSIRRGGDQDPEGPQTG
jgi:integrase